MNTNQAHWSVGITALGLLGVAAAILYLGVFKQPFDPSAYAPTAANNNTLPLGDKLDFSLLNRRSASSADLSYPSLDPAAEVGVDVSGLFWLGQTGNTGQIVNLGL